MASSTMRAGFSARTRLALFSTSWRLEGFQRDNPNVTTDQATQLATEFVTAAGQSGSQVNTSA